MAFRKNRFLASFTIAAITAVVLITLMTIFAELAPEFKDWLKASFSHHWIGKGVVAGIVFFVLGFILHMSQVELGERKLAKHIKALSTTTVVSFFVLLLFFVYETISH